MDLFAKPQPVSAFNVWTTVTAKADSRVEKTFVSSTTPIPFLVQAKRIVTPLVESAIQQPIPAFLAPMTSNAAKDECATLAFVPTIVPVEITVAVMAEPLEVAPAEMNAMATPAFLVNALRALRMQCVPTWLIS